MTVTNSKRESACQIRLAGEIGFSEAAGLKKALDAWLVHAKDLELDLEHATQIDLTTLQLLGAAGREAAQRGLRIDCRASSEVRSAALRAGFLQIKEFPIRD